MGAAISYGPSRVPRLRAKVGVIIRAERPGGREYSCVTAIRRLIASSPFARHYANDKAGVNLLLNYAVAFSAKEDVLCKSA